MQPSVHSSTWPGKGQAGCFPVSWRIRKSPLTVLFLPFLSPLLFASVSSLLSINTCPSVLLSLVWSYSSKCFLHNTCPDDTSVTCGYPRNHVWPSHASVCVKLCPSLLSRFEYVPFNHEYGSPLREDLQQGAQGCAAGRAGILSLLLTFETSGNIFKMYLISAAEIRGSEYHVQGCCQDFIRWIRRRSYYSSWCVENHKCTWLLLVAS